MTAHEDLLSVREIGEVVVVDFCQQMLADTTENQWYSFDIGQALLAVIESTAKKKVTLNLGNVTCIDGGVWGALVAFSKRVPGLQLVLCNMSKGVEKHFKERKLDKWFMVAPSETEALQLLT